MNDLETVAKEYLNKIHDWNNDDNAQYYDAISLETFQKFVELGGLDTYCDLALLHSQIMRANAILEVAAGCGRALDGLLQMGYQNKVVAVERCSKFYSLLQKYTQKKAFDIEVIHADIRNFHSTQKFDLILWLWSGMCDFTTEEQFSVLEKLLFHLNFGGLIVLDTMPCSFVPGNAVWSSEHYSVIPGGENSYLYVYTPSNEEIDCYARNLGLQVKHIPYRTTTNRPRILHLLSQPTSI
jgi:hypothetical protein